MKISNITSTLTDVDTVMKSLHIISIEFDNIEFEKGFTPIHDENVSLQCDIIMDFIDDNVVQQILRKRMTETNAPIMFTKVTRDEFGITVHFTHWDEDDTTQQLDVRYDESAEAYMVFETSASVPYMYLIPPGDKMIVLRALDKIAAHVKRASGLFDDLIQYSDDQCKTLLHYSKNSTLDPEIYGDLTIPQLLDFIFVGYHVDFIQMKPFELLPVDIQEALLSLNLRTNLEEKWSEKHVLHKLTENIKLKVIREPETVLQAISLKFEYTESLDGEPDTDYIKILTHTYHALNKCIDQGIVNLGTKSPNEWIFSAMGDEAILDEYYDQLDSEAGIRGIDTLEFLHILKFASKHVAIQELILQWSKDPQYD